MKNKKEASPVVKRATRILDPVTKRHRVYAAKSDPSRSKVKQAPKMETDINAIMARAHATGLAPMSLSQRSALYGDFTQIDDFHEAMTMITEAKQRFEQLPSSVRSRFGNDPHNLIEFLKDESNFDEAVKLGLCEPRPTNEPPPAEPPAHPTEE